MRVCHNNFIVPKESVWWNCEQSYSWHLLDLTSWNSLLFFSATRVSGWLDKDSLSLSLSLSLSQLNSHLLFSNKLKKPSMVSWRSPAIISTKCQRQLQWRWSLFRDIALAPWHLGRTFSLQLLSQQVCR